jgi:hypothetical protein
MSIGPATRYVADIVRAYKSQELINPDYQREYLWSHKKALHFLSRTRTLEHVLGVITTYRLRNGTTNFLQDGRQRVTTLMMAIDRPMEFGLSKDDVDAISRAQVSQQSMIYDSHDDARLDFQHLNDGVGLIPYEKYRGDLECDDAGRSLYQAVRVKVDDLTMGMAGISRSSEHGRKKSGQLHRHSLGLFYKYVTRHKDLQLYAKSERSINDQIERRVRAWLENNMDDWHSKCDGFIRSLENVNAVLRDATKVYEQKRWDMVAVRAMYSAYLHCKSIGCVSDVFADLVQWFVLANVNRKTWSSRYEIDLDGSPTSFRLNQVSLGWLNRVHEFGGPAIECVKRTKRLVAPAGYDESHVVPHADGGTETFTEPAITNRARGRNPVDQ